MSDTIKYMDDAHRLKPMAENYDRHLFNTLFKETKSLRKKLAYEIDARKFGVDYGEVCSWFDVKFIHTFNKYHSDPKVKGFIINALKTLKYRIIKNSYLNKNELHQTIDVTELYDFGELSEEVQFDFSGDTRLEMALSYLKSILSPDAIFIMEIDLNPPPYILNKLQNSEQKKIPKLPTDLIVEYLGIEGNPEDAIDYVEALRKEIKLGIEKAQVHFRNLKLN